MKIYLSKSQQKNPAGFVPCIDFMNWMHIYLDLLMLMDVLEILFWTIPGRDAVNQYKPFIQDRVKYYLEGVGYVQDKNH